MKYCDYVLLGEGDESILEMVEAVRRKETPSFPGVAYRKDGRLIHTGERMTPYELQLENIKASKKIYSFPRLVQALLQEDALHKLLFAGEYFWHMSIRADLRRELPYLEKRSSI